MTLGEALSLRAKQAQKLNDLRGRIKANAITQEGEVPAENADVLIAEYTVLSTIHSALLVQIASTNAATSVDGKTLVQMLQQREDLIRERNIYGSTADAATPNSGGYRYMRSELRYVAQVDVADLRRKEEETGEEVRALDAQIQHANWQTELI